MWGGNRRLADALAAGLLVAASGLTACGFGAMEGYGCTDRDERFADRLDELAVLDLRPPDSTLVDRYKGCDDDDGFAGAGRTYRPAPIADVLAYYHETMPAQGWKLESVNDDPVKPDALVVQASRLCYTRVIEGTDAYFSVAFASDFGEKSDEFWVEVTASHDGAAWC